MPLLAATGALLVAAHVTAAENLDVLAPPTQGTNAPASALNAHLDTAALAALDRRKAAYETIKTPEDVAGWQRQRRGFFLRQLGGFPRRTPLNAEVTGQIDGGDYRVEKIMFESEPNHHVTGLLYLPKTTPPYPAVLVPCGHSANGKGAESYQRVSILLAKNGLAAFCYDPIGQGERSQILKPDGRPALPCTAEHTIIGIGAILLGRNTATYRIWDGMRAIDFLQSRPDIDPQRIGCTGNSGGGTLTSYLMALDDRIVAAAPACYLTSFRKVLEKLDPQDGEQNIFGQIAFGMDHADYVIMRAPRPTLMCVATRDAFDIAGSWESFREAKRIYGRLGFANHVDLVEDDAPHSFNAPLRVGAVRWMRRWLLHIDDDIVEPDIATRKDDEIRCSPKGQVMRLPGERSVFDLNAEAGATLAAQRSRLWAETPKGEMLQRVRQIVGVPAAESRPATHRQVGAIERRGYHIEKLILEAESGIPLPALAFVPPNPDADAFLYLNDGSKQADAAEGGPIAQCVARGHVALAVDLRSIGETQDRRNRWYTKTFGPMAGDFYKGYLLGRSLVGMWTEDVLACAHFLGSYDTRGGTRKVHLVASGIAGIPALHAVAFEPDIFASLTLRRTLPSWASIVANPNSRQDLVTAVHGALQVYDLPDLVASIPSEKIRIEEAAR